MVPALVFIVVGIIGAGLVLFVVELRGLVVDIDRATVAADGLLVVLSGVILFCISADTAIDFQLLRGLSQVVRSFGGSRVVTYCRVDVFGLGGLV